MTSTDLRALGRLGQANGHAVPPRRRRRLAMRAVRGVPAATPRRRVPRPLVAALVGLLMVLGYLGVTAARQSEPAPPTAAVGLVGADDAADEPPKEGRNPLLADRASRSGGATEHAPDAADVVPLGEVEGLEVALPHPDPVLVAFHEASLPGALALTPRGTLERNENPTKFEPDGETEGPAYHVLASRGRPRPATSAVDVVVPRGATVRAPVSGRVVEAREYALYGSTRDWRVVIEARDRADLQVVLIHLHEPAVAPGDEVEAGRTAIGVARQLPFTSHVDVLVDAGEGDDDQPLPHVHLEVKAATSPKPIDPNQPAVEPHEALGTSLE